MLVDIAVIRDFVEVLSFDKVRLYQSPISH